MKSKQSVTLFTLVGSFLIFFSWITENYLQRKWDNRLNKSIFWRDILKDENHSKDVYDLYSAHFYNLYKYDTMDFRNREEASYGNYHYGMKVRAMRFYLAELQRANKINSDEDWFNKEIDTADYMRDEIDYYCNNHIVDSAHTFTHDKNWELNELIAKVMPRVNDFDDYARNQSDYANTTFLYLYILGSICLGIAYIINRKMEHG